MVYRCSRQIVVSLLLGLLAAQATAHTTVIGTSPQSGAILEQSPPSIEIRFHDPVRLASVVAVQSAKPEHKLEFTPTDSAAKFTVIDPKLGPGASGQRHGLPLRLDLATAVFEHVDNPQDEALLRL